MKASRVVTRFVLPALSVAALIFFYGTYLARVKEGLSISWVLVLEKALFILVVILMAYWTTSIAIALIGWYGRKVAGRTDSKLDDNFLPLVEKLAGIAIWVIALIAILNYLGVSITAMLATVGVGSLAIALAAQDTISNIIAGFLIIIDRPFRVGDDVRLPSGERVVVLSIGNRRTKFRAEDGSIIIMPNLELSKSKIVNFTYGAEGAQ
jgi:small-conductance mechanosensitive channel